MKKKEHEVIREKRMEAGLKQYFVADKVGITKWHLCEYERYNAPIKPDTLKKLQRFFGIED